MKQLGTIMQHCVIGLKTKYMKLKLKKLASTYQNYIKIKCKKKTYL